MAAGDPVWRVPCATPGLRRGGLRARPKVAAQHPLWSGQAPFARAGLLLLLEELLGFVRAFFGTRAVPEYPTRLRRSGVLRASSTALLVG